MDMVKVLIEFIGAFIIVYAFYYIFVLRKCKKSKKYVPAEVNLILAFYKIDVKKIDLYQMIKVVSFATTFIIALIITIVGCFFDSTIVLLIFCTLISVLLAVIIYRLIGRYYERKSNKKTS